MTSIIADVAAGMNQVELPIMLIDLTTLEIAGANGALNELTHFRGEDLVGASLLELVAPEEREDVEEACGALLSGRLDGYQDRRTFRSASGRRFRASTWVRRVDIAESGCALVVVIPEAASSTDQPIPQGLLTSSPMDAAMLVTDHDWRIEWVSPGASRLLGSAGESLAGQPLLGLIHPSDAPEFFLAVTQSTTSEHTVGARVRLRSDDGTWCGVSSAVTGLCRHSPPRLGLVVTADAAASEGVEPSRTDQLEKALWRIGLELRSAGINSTQPAAALAGGGESESLARFSSRQWEIIDRLLDGQPVGRIADAMFLSPSTVRNHLSGVYRKLGIHSQVELMSLFRDRSHQAS